MTVADLTRERLCLPAMRGRDAPAVLLELSAAFAEAGLVSDSLSLCNATLNDHFLSEHDVLGSVAYPVCRLPSLDSPVLAVGRGSGPIQWRPGFPSVRLVFLIATPLRQSRRLERLLTTISDLARDDAMLARLLSADDAEQLLETLRMLPLPGGEPLTPGLLV
jgi:mannitol/fructose-specific phosphotransferase system IIA component (Ntr-type)